VGRCERGGNGQLSRSHAEGSQAASDLTSLASSGIDELRWPSPLRLGDQIYLRTAVLLARRRFGRRTGRPGAGRAPSAAAGLTGNLPAAYVRQLKGCFLEIGGGGDGNRKDPDGNTESKGKTMTVQSLALTKPPVVRTDMLIRCPVAEVYEAFVNPAVTTKFWFTKSSGRLERGARVRWDWEMFDLHTVVTVKEAEAGRRLLLEWNPDLPSTVEFAFTPEGGNATQVVITESDLRGAGDEIVAHLVDSASGFSKVLAAAKAWLEHGITLNVVADHQVEGH
jgi:uncharacterized protein YndB with AHSA1/START domain